VAASRRDSGNGRTKRRPEVTIKYFVVESNPMKTAVRAVAGTTGRE